MLVSTARAAGSVRQYNRGGLTTVADLPEQGSRAFVASSHVDRASEDHEALVGCPIPHAYRVHRSLRLPARHAAEPVRGDADGGGRGDSSPDGRLADAVPNGDEAGLRTVLGEEP